MNLVTPRQRQEWLSRAEDYADIVKMLFSSISRSTFVFPSFAVSSTYEIRLTSRGKILFSLNIYRRWYSYVDAMG